MKKGLIATASLALVIGGMVVYLSVQMCNWVPSFKTACWVQEQIPDRQEVLLVHQSQMSTWHERLDVQYKDESLTHDQLASSYEAHVSVAQDCKIRANAAYALGHSEAEEALTSLEFIAVNAECLAVRKAAVHAIEGIGSDEARASLIRIIMATAR